MKTAFVLLCIGLPVMAADLRLGIIGTDTSHAVAFTKTLNDEKNTDHIAGARVVAAFKGGSPDVEESASRVEKYADELREKWGVTLVEKISDLCPLVDGILLESLDGRPHLAQFREAAQCGKPVFIDKPLSATLSEAREIARAAEHMKIPWFSSSALRYSAVASMKGDEVMGAMVWGPGPLEAHHPLDMAWYGIHAVEMLYTILGTGCAEVSRVKTADEDVVTGRWKDGRMGTVHLQRPYGKFGAVVFLKGDKLNSMPDMPFSYVPLVRDIVKFMETKTPPVDNRVTLEMFAFMEAAQRSGEEGGKLVALAAGR